MKKIINISHQSGLVVETKVLVVFDVRSHFLVRFFSSPEQQLHWHKHITGLVGEKKNQRKFPGGEIKMQFRVRAFIADVTNDGGGVSKYEHGTRRISRRGVMLPALLSHVSVLSCPRGYRTRVFSADCTHFFTVCEEDLSTMTK